MKRVLILVLILVAITATVQAKVNVSTEANFSASSLTAKDVDCRKCHTDTPHIIHSSKPVSCENCHGDKTSVAIPQCTKCHNGPIHKVHAGKIEKGCEYCHKNIVPIHTNLIGDTVCSHCHKDLVEVHGQGQSCVKCHKAPPNIVKPLKTEGMILICQNCHPASSVATIHGDLNSKQGCYNCHKGTSKINSSDIPHQIHKDKASCKDCHEDNSKVVIPQCSRCHKIDELHAFNKIGKLTTKSGLTCPVCHADISKPAEAKAPARVGTPAKIETNVTGTKEIIKETDIVPIQKKEEEKGPLKIPGFEIIPGILILYIVARKMSK